MLSKLLVNLYGIWVEILLWLSLIGAVSLAYESGVAGKFGIWGVLGVALGWLFLYVVFVAPGLILEDMRVRLKAIEKNTKSSQVALQNAPQSVPRNESVSRPKAKPSSASPVEGLSVDASIEHRGKEIVRKGKYFYVDDMDFTSEWRAKDFIDKSIDE